MTLKLQYTPLGNLKIRTLDRGEQRALKRVLIMGFENPAITDNDYALVKPLVTFIKAKIK